MIRQQKLKPDKDKSKEELLQDISILKFKLEQIFLITELELKILVK